MRIYLEIVRLGVHQQLAYRAATLAGLFTNVSIRDGSLEQMIRELCLSDRTSTRDVK